MKEGKFFAPITCSCLGYQYSSQTQIGPLWDSRSFGQAGISCFANLSQVAAFGGNLVVRDHAVIQDELTGSLHFCFTHNSRASSPQGLWHFSQEKRLTSKDGMLTIEDGDGHTRPYTLNTGSTNVYTGPGFADGTPFVTFDAANNCYRWYLRISLNSISHFSLIGHRFQF